MTQKYLCLIFGLVPSTISPVIKQMLHLVTQLLRKHPAARITFPDKEKMEYFSKLLRSREQRVNDVIGFMDGLSLKIECKSDLDTQNAFYNGCQSDTGVSNVFIYGPDGKVFMCATNFPGSWPDSSICSKILQYVSNHIGDYKICVDQGFPRDGAAYDIFVGPILEKSKNLSPILREKVLDKVNAYISLRQAAEWGMRSLQISFPRIKRRLPTDSSLREKIILSIVLLHNFGTEFVGINQIASVFNP